MSIEITGLNSTVLVSPLKGTSGSNSTFASVLQGSSDSASVDLDSIFEKASATHHVPLNLLKAVAKAESDFEPNATSPCGAMGIMQLMPETAEYLGVSDGYDPEQNIMGGAKYLSELLSRFDGNTSLAVAGYNAGPDAVEKYDGIPPYNETQNYVKTVLGYLGDSISAGTVNASSGNAASVSGMPPASSKSSKANLAALLEGSLLSGGMSSDVSSLITTLRSTINSKDASSKLMASVYQLQLEMLRGSGDSSSGSVIV